MNTSSLSIVPTQNSEIMFLLGLLFLISGLKWKGDQAKKEMFGNAKFAVSFAETVAVLWGHVYFICFFKEFKLRWYFISFETLQQ